VTFEGLRVDTANLRCLIVGKSPNDRQRQGLPFVSIQGLESSIEGIRLLTPRPFRWTISGSSREIDPAPRVHDGERFLFQLLVLSKAVL
jgi:hypothetical protein